MIVRWGALTRADGLSEDEFAAEWLDRHVPLVRSAPGLRSYRQNVVVDAEQRSPFPRGGREFDGFAQLEFDSLNDMRTAMEHVRDDPQVHLAHFAREATTFAAVRKLDLAPPPGRRLLKRISLLRRAEATNPACFQEEWWGEHSRLVAAMDGYAGYAQNLVIGAVDESGKIAGEVAFDGAVEFWFEDLDSMQRFYGSAAFAGVAAHGEEFIGEITTYLVEEHIAGTGEVR